MQRQGRRSGRRWHCKSRLLRSGVRTRFPPMLTQEYYVRGINDTDARGPFTIDQLITLGDTGQINGETLFYDAGTEQWATIGSNEELKNAVFPPKRRLSVKAKDNITTLNVANEEQRPITVEQMLAAAEGRTDETKDKRRHIVAQHISARIGLFSTLVIFLLSAAAFLVPHIEVVASPTWEKIAQQPFVIVGVVDFACALMLGLGMVAIYPFIRFRAALGLGFFGLLYWSQDRPLLALAVVVGSIGTYLCTIFLSYFPIVIAAAMGLAGIGGVAYFMLT